MKHNRETINAKLRAYKTTRGTLQEFVDEITAFFEELQQRKGVSDFIDIDEVLGES